MCLFLVQRLRHQLSAVGRFARRQCGGYCLAKGMKVAFNVTQGEKGQQATEVKVMVPPEEAMYHGAGACKQREPKRCRGWKMCRKRQQFEVRSSPSTQTRAMDLWAVRQRCAWSLEKKLFFFIFWLPGLSSCLVGFSSYLASRFGS